MDSKFVTYIPIYGMDGHYLLQPNVVTHYYTGFAYENERGYVEVHVGNQNILWDLLIDVFDINITQEKQVKEYILELGINKLFDEGYLK